MLIFTVVGAAFRPSEAKDQLRSLVEGDIVQLQADPENPYDQTAVAVYSEGHHVGFIPKYQNAPVFAALQGGEELTAEIVDTSNSLKPTAQVEF